MKGKTVLAANENRPPSNDHEDEPKLRQSGPKQFPQLAQGDGQGLVRHLEICVRRDLVLNLCKFGLRAFEFGELLFRER